MSLFALSAVGIAGLAPTFAGLIEQNPHLEWRWIQWLNLMFANFFSSSKSDIDLSVRIRFSGAYAFVVLIFFDETRGK